MYVRNLHLLETEKTRRETYKPKCCNKYVCICLHFRNECSVNVPHYI